MSTFAELNSDLKLSIKRYIKTIKGDYKNHCNECDFKAKSKRIIKAHKLRVHEGVNYPCNQCDTKFTDLRNLKRHQMSVHEGVKYPCNQCDSNFAFHANLLVSRFKELQSLQIRINIQFNECQLGDDMDDFQKLS